jgi:hypothetical protein
MAQELGIEWETEKFKKDVENRIGSVSFNTSGKSLELCKERCILKEKY